MGRLTLPDVVSARQNPVQREAFINPSVQDQRQVDVRCSSLRMAARLVVGMIGTVPLVSVLLISTRRAPALCRP